MQTGRIGRPRLMGGWTLGISWNQARCFAGVAIHRLESRLGPWGLVVNPPSRKSEPCVARYPAPTRPPTQGDHREAVALAVGKPLNYRRESRGSRR